MAPDNQLETEDMWGLVKELSVQGDKIVIKMNNEKYPNNEFPTPINVYATQDSALFERVQMDIEQGMRIGVRFSARKYINANTGKTNKTRTLLEIFGRDSSPQLSTQTAPVQNVEPEANLSSTNGWTPTPSDSWRADGAADGNAISNATAVILKYYEKNGDRPSKQWMDEMADDINYQASAIRLRRTATPEIAEELAEEDNPF